MTRVHRLSPAELSVSWPDIPSSDLAAETARRFAINLRDALGEMSIRSVATKAGISEGTIRHVGVDAARFPNGREDGFAPRFCCSPLARAHIGSKRSHRFRARSSVGI
jgi:hypothetical protein